MGCFVLLAALISPRLALGVVWILTEEVEQAFDSWVWPVLGFVFLPWTTLAYAVAYDPIDEVSTLGWLVVAVGLLLDVGSWNRSAERRR